MAVDGSTERLVVRIDDETPPLHMWPEVLHGEVQGQKLPVESTVLAFCRRELL